MTQRKFIYHIKTERLFIEWEEGDKIRTEEKVAIDRDQWDNPVFNIEPEEKSHWIQIGKWVRNKGKPTQYHALRAFYKCLEYTDTRQIITYYNQEQKIEEAEKGSKKPVKDIYIFTFDFRDIAFKNNKGEWAYKNKEGQPLLEKD